NYKIFSNFKPKFSKWYVKLNDTNLNLSIVYLQKMKLQVICILAVAILFGAGDNVSADYICPGMISANDYLMGTCIEDQGETRCVYFFQDSTKDCELTYSIYERKFMLGL